MPTATTSSSDRLNSSRCPECGAPVDWRHIPPEQSQVECSYCGTLIRVPGRTPQPKPEPAVVINTQQRGAGCSWAGAITVLAMIAAAAIFVFSGTTYPSVDRVVEQIIGQSFGSTESNGEPIEGTRVPALGNPLPGISQALTPKSRLTGQPYQLVNNDQLGVQLLVTAYQEDGSLLIGFDPTTRREGWRSPLLSAATHELGIFSDAQRVYIADGAALMALDRENGAVVWQTSLANNLQSSCPEQAACLQQIGGQVVALTRDGTVQAFVGATGAPLWSRRLNSTPRQLMAAHDQVLALDTNADNGAIVLVLDSATGDVQHEIAPTCNEEGFGDRAHVSDQFFVTPDASALVVLGSGNYACAWRFDLPDGARSWRYESHGVDPLLPFAWAFGSWAFADPVAYFIDETDDPAQIWTLDTRNGQTPDAPLYSVAQYDLELLQTTENLLLVSAVPTYANDEVELWAIDRTTGERRWQRRLETTHTFDKWLVHPTADGIFVAVCQWNDDLCRFLVLDPETGVSRAEVRHELGGSLVGGAWLGDRAYLTIDGALHVLDLDNAEMVYSWP